MALIVLPITTSRLVIRRFTPTDYPAYFAYHSNPSVYRYLYSNAVNDHDAAIKFAEVMLSKFSAEGDVFYFAVEEQQSGALIGEVLLKLASLNAKQAEIGYIFNPEFCGKGYASEASAAVLKIAFSSLNFHRVFARLDSLNRGSIGVVERLGMRKEAHFIQNDQFNGMWGDEFVYAMLNTEWLQRQQIT